MFTGIITAIGRLEAITDKGDRLLRISCDWDCAAIDIGASIACSGICLTVIDRQDHWFEVAVSAETMAVTTLGNWQQGNRINLERALCLGDELGGHIVSGHVDGLAVIVNAVKGNAFSLNIIQHSWDVTGWGQAVVGQKMNMEIDMLARYVARLAAFDKD